MYDQIIYFFIITSISNFCVCRDYFNYTLYRVIPVNENDIIFLSTLDTFYDVNFWREPGVVHSAVEFVLHPKDQPHFMERAKAKGLYVTTLIEDVQSAFNRQTVQKYIRRKMTSMNWDNYFRLEDIYNWLTDLSKAYPHEVSLINIGQTYENRSILAVKVVLNNSKNRSTIIVEGGIHAREWIAPAVVTYLINSIVHAGSSENADLRLIAHTYEWYFVPVMNPDGYEYSHTQDRLWRKNRNGNGVDLNRNFGVSFGTTGVSWFPSSESYCGPRAFSEKESKAMSDFITSKSDRLEYYIAFHSYGQYMILPYGHLIGHAENYDEVYSVCQDVITSIKKRYNTQYKTGNPFETVGYTTSGVSSCWVKRAFNVMYVITMELRDLGKDGFALPTSEILPTCEETLDGMITLFTPRTANFTTKVKRHNSGKRYQVSKKYIICFHLFYIYYNAL